MTAGDPPRLYTYRDLAEQTGIPVQTLYVWHNRGKLPPEDYRVGQSPAWLPETVRAWIRANKTTTTNKGE